MSLRVISRRASRHAVVACALALTMMILVACGAERTAATATPGVASPPASATSTATPTATPKPIEKLRFMAGFAPQANLPFVAAYVAQERRFFAEERLEVDIRHSSGADEHLKLLLNKDVDFITATASQALRRSTEGLPTMAIALFGQRGDQGYVARADSGIKGPADFKGRTIGFKAGVVPAELEGMLRTVGLTRNDVKLVSVGFDPREFIQGKVDIYPVFLGNEPDTIRKAGVPITVFDPHEYQVPTLGLTFLAHRDTVTQRTDVAERFLRATLRATTWIEANPDAAIEITLKYAKGAEPTHQRFLLGVDLENAKRADGMGRASAAQWQGLADLLTGYKVLSRQIDAKQAYDFTIVDRLYGTGQIK
ncbi:MAG: ABC transporter substrate-binding protein [Chloroflexi bacterium]|nr:ABC transporter substrate-binding protein [Chloroflexota bacterium]